MSKTARMVLKIVGASLAFAACVCLIIGGWHDLSVATAVSAVVGAGNTALNTTITTTTKNCSSENPRMCAALPCRKRRRSFNFFREKRGNREIAEYIILRTARV